MAASNDHTAFEIKRHFKSTRAVVWKAWSEPDQLQNWWGPKGCSVQVVCLEFWPGGFFHYSMKFENAPMMWGRFNYREIATPERLVWLNSFANEKCGIARAAFSEICPLEIQNSVTFTEQAGITTVTLHAEPFGAVEVERKFFAELCSSGSLAEGYGGTFDQLDEFLSRT